VSGLPTAARTGQAAIDYANSRVGGYMPAAGYCLAFTRENYAAPAVYASAADQWNGAVQVPGDRNPPPGVPVYFRTPSIYDHVAFHCGDGRIVSTFNDEIRAYTSIGHVENVFDGTYQGWSHDICERLVHVPTAPPVVEMEDPEMFVISQNLHGLALVGSNYYHPFNGEEWYTYEEQVTRNGVVPVVVLPDGDVGARQWDIIVACHTIPAE